MPTAVLVHVGADNTTTPPVPQPKGLDMSFFFSLLIAASIVLTLLGVISQLSVLMDSSIEADGQYLFGGIAVILGLLSLAGWMALIINFDISISDRQYMISGIAGLAIGAILGACVFISDRRRSRRIGGY